MAILPLERRGTAKEGDWIVDSLRTENAELRRRLDDVQLELAEIDLERQMLVVELGAVNQELDRLVRTLEQQAITDALTGLYNKRYLWEALEREVARCERTRRPLAAMFIDIDFFKRCNDTYGHATGDEVLRQVAEVVGGIVRRGDVLCGVEGASTLARFGGEEFVLVLPETDIEGAAVAAERIRQTVDDTIFHGAGGSPELRITVSCGVSAYGPGDKGSFRGVLDRADRALYDAKRNGRNRVEQTPPEPVA